MSEVNPELLDKVEQFAAELVRDGHAGGEVAESLVLVACIQAFAQGRVEKARIRQWLMDTFELAHELSKVHRPLKEVIKQGSRN